MGKALSKPVCLVAGISYPAYASFKALESPSPHDDKQWLTYWAVYGICTSMETVSARFLSWFPGYYFAKMLVLIWMMLPRTKGALILYTSAIRPLLKAYEPVIDRKLDDAQAVADECVQDIKENGPDAVTRRIVTAKNSEFVQNVKKGLESAVEAAATANKEQT